MSLVAVTKLYVLSTNELLVLVSPLPLNNISVFQLVIQMLPLMIQAILPIKFAAVILQVSIVSLPI